MASNWYQLKDLEFRLTLYNDDNKGGRVAEVCGFAVRGDFMCSFFGFPKILMQFFGSYKHFYGSRFRPFLRSFSVFAEFSCSFYRNFERFFGSWDPFYTPWTNVSTHLYITGRDTYTWWAEHRLPSIVTTLH